MSRPSSKPLVHNMVRWLSKRDLSVPELRFFSSDDIDAHVGAWLADGYKLFNTHPAGENPEAFGILYILVREP